MSEKGKKRIMFYIIFAISIEFNVLDDIPVKKSVTVVQVRNKKHNFLFNKGIF